MNSKTETVYLLVPFEITYHTDEPRFREKAIELALTVRSPGSVAVTGGAAAKMGNGKSQIPKEQP